MISVGVIGYGYWGPNLVRNFAKLADARVVRVSDFRQDRLAAVTASYPTTKVSTDYRDIISDPSVDAVVVATPVETHFDLGMAALRAGKHVLMEKPLASTSDEAAQLIDEAERRGLVLMVDHTFVFTSAVQKMRELTVSGELGDIQYYDSVRINLGLFQRDVNVLWDLAVHDLSIMDFVIGRRPVSVSATGLAHVPGSPENIAYLSMSFERQLIAHVHANWLAPVKMRRTLIGGSWRMLVFDDLEASEKIKVYDRGISVAQSPDDVNLMRIGYRTGDISVPHLAMREALHGVASHFIDIITTGAPPLSNGHAGLRTVRVLEAATKRNQVSKNTLGRCTDTNLKRSVAVKVLPESLAGDANRLARFQREAEVLAALNHPNIAQIHGLEKSAGTIALVMELVEGPTLADRIAQGAVPVDEALPIAKQIAEALEVAHEQGVSTAHMKNPIDVNARGRSSDIDQAQGIGYVARKVVLDTYGGWDRLVAKLHPVTHTERVG